MSSAAENLLSGYTDLLREGPPFRHALEFARRCVEDRVAPADLLAAHLSMADSAGYDVTTSETVMAMIVAFRALLLQLQDAQAEFSELEQEGVNLSSRYRTKSSTLSMVAHDLSSYLVSTRMMALSMLRDSKEDLVHDRCRHILKVVDDQEHLVANLLSIGKIEAGIATVYPSHVDLKAVVVRCVESARRMTSHVFSVVGPGLDVLAEEDKVRQIVENLVGNAVKFSPGGGSIEITLCVEAARAVVEVQDHGIGIAPSDMPHLFEPYYRAVEGQTGGTGLGLSIVKSLLDLMDGQVHIDSSVNGTTVRFTLPLVKVIQ